MENRGKEGEKKGLYLVQVVSGGAGTTLVLVSYQSDRGGTVFVLRSPQSDGEGSTLGAPSLIGEAWSLDWRDLQPTAEAHNYQLFALCSPSQVCLRRLPE